MKEACVPCILLSHTTGFRLLPQTFFMRMFTTPLCSFSLYMDLVVYWPAFSWAQWIRSLSLFKCIPSSRLSSSSHWLISVTPNDILKGIFHSPSMKHSQTRHCLLEQYSYSLGKINQRGVSGQSQPTVTISSVYSVMSSKHHLKKPRSQPLVSSCGPQLIF